MLTGGIFGRIVKARPRPVPPPGAIASASLPGYRRAGVGAGCVDPLPPTAPPRHLLRRTQALAWRCSRAIVLLAPYRLAHVGSSYARLADRACRPTRL